MSSVTNLRANRRDDSMEWQLRVDLAAAFRLAAELNWHEAVANHFSLAVSPDGKRFLMNPKWRHFGRVKASELLLLDANDKETMSRPDAPDASAWCIHGHLHASPQAPASSTHPPYATAIATLADPDLPPIEQNTARYYDGSPSTGGRRHRRTRRRSAPGSHDRHQAACDAREPRRAGHTTVAEAFDDLYYLERACQTLVLAY
jgi:ribulose-5-phosphate 4-epimerase/fuculose-1-phosphate aldolase